MSTTALSHTTAKLKAGLGVRLFNRTTRSVALTDAGKLFVGQVGPALQDIHGALEAVRSQHETPSGIPSSLSGHELDLVTEGRLIDIVADGFDLGVRIAGLVPSDMIAVPLGRPQRYGIVGSPDYFKRHDKPRVPPSLLNHRCIRARLSGGALFRWRSKDGETVQIDVRGPIMLDEASLARIAVMENIGIGCFMEQSALADMEAGRLVRVLEGWTPPFAGLCLYYPGRRNLSAGEKAFLALARESAASNAR